MKTLRKRKTQGEVACRCGSFTEVILTRLSTVTKGIGVRKVLNIFCADCEEVKV